MAQISNNKRKKNWFVFTAFFFSIVVLALTIVTLFYMFRFRAQFSTIEFYFLLSLDIIVLIASLAVISWSIYLIFKDVEQICFPYPTLTPFIYGFSESQLNPSQKMFGNVNG